MNLAGPSRPGKDYEICARRFSDDWNANSAVADATTKREGDAFPGLKGGAKLRPPLRGEESLWKKQNGPNQNHPPGTYPGSCFHSLNRARTFLALATTEKRRTANRRLDGEDDPRREARPAAATRWRRQRNIPSGTP